MPLPWIFVFFLLFFCFFSIFLLSSTYIFSHATLAKGLKVSTFILFW